MSKVARQNFAAESISFIHFEGFATGHPTDYVRFAVLLGILEQLVQLERKGHVGTTTTTTAGALSALLSGGAHGGEPCRPGRRRPAGIRRKVKTLPLLSAAEFHEKYSEIGGDYQLTAPSVPSQVRSSRFLPRASLQLFCAGKRRVTIYVGQWKEK